MLMQYKLEIVQWIVQLQDANDDLDPHCGPGPPQPVNSVSVSLSKIEDSSTARHAPKRSLR